MADEGSTLIFGASGQVGRALSHLLGPRGSAVDQADADFARPETLVPLLDRCAPSAVINAAAYTAVDRAETEETLAHIINADAPAVIARWCAERDVPFVHYSTDYVFPGDGIQPWKETDPVGPLNAYGRSKLAGEERVAAAGGRWLVLRTSWVYDHLGPNFLTTVLRLARERDEMSVVADQVGAPTYAQHLAAATLRTLGAAVAAPSFASGVYHLCGAGETSWHGFAEQILAEARARGIELRLRHLHSIPTAEYPLPAERPRNSRLDTTLAARTFGAQLPDWRAGLSECMHHL